MKLSLSCAATRVALGESPPCALLMTNDGATDDEAPNLALNKAAPLLRVRGPGPDEVAEFDPAGMFARRGVRPLPQWPDERPVVTLAPGETRREAFDLLERAVLPRPGRVTLEALLRRGEPPEELASPPLELEVAPVDPLWLAPAHGHGGFDHRVLLAWVQGGEPAAVHVTAFDALRGRIFPRASFRVGEADAAAQPLVSTSLAGAGPARRHVAWLHEGVLRWAAFGRRAPVPPEAPTQLVVGPGSRLLGPVLVDAETEAPRAFVRLASGAVRVFSLDDGGAETVDLSLPEPAWSHLLAPAQGGPRLLVATGGPQVELHLVAWDERPQTVVRLGAWRGDLAAAAAVVCPDDLVRGVVLCWFRRRPEEEPTLVGVRWQLDPQDGRFEATTPRSCGWDRRLKTPPLTLRLDGNGEPHVLARDEEGGWWYAPSFAPPRRLFEPEDARAGAPKPKQPPRPAGPVDLVFAAEGRVPLLLFHEADAGLRVLPLGAEPLPEPGSPELTQPELEER